MTDASLEARVRGWIDDDVDAGDRAELEALLAKGDEAELASRFSGPLEFGTAGLRGVLGAGESRMCRAVVRRTTLGLARWLLKTDPRAKERGVVVGYDGRRNSRVFAEDACAVLVAAGLKAHLFPRLGPTPLVAFGTLALDAAAGVMVTASHNPPEYNGYKVYAGNGAQIIPPADTGIAAEIAAAPGAKGVPLADLAIARRDGLVVDIADSVIDAYHAAVKGLSRDARGRDGVRIVHTSLHGTAEPFTRRALAEVGFLDVHSVAAQKEPDGAFPTVAFPNPEEPGALDLSFALAREVKATLILANDPDSDRLAVAVPEGDGFRALTGNEIGLLLGEFLLRREPGGAARLVVTTVVSSPALPHVAEVLGATAELTLTGFKWIANRALELEKTGLRFVFGYEEALGYTVGTVVRDKDGVSAAAVFAELAALAAIEGRTVSDELERIARTYGLFASRQHNVTKKGKAGAAEIAALMDRLRAAAPRVIGRFPVRAVRDLEAGTRTEDGVSTPLSLPKSNVLAFDLEGGHRVVARPSGTEPKIKFYFDVRETVAEGEPFSAAKARAETSLDDLERAFLEVAR